MKGILEKGSRSIKQKRQGNIWYYMFEGIGRRKDLRPSSVSLQSLRGKESGWERVRKTRSKKEGVTIIIIRMIWYFPLYKWWTKRRKVKHNEERDPHWLSCYRYVLLGKASIYLTLLFCRFLLVSWQETLCWLCSYFVYSKLWSVCLQGLRCVFSTSLMWLHNHETYSLRGKNNYPLRFSLLNLVSTYNLHVLSLSKRVLTAKIMFLSSLFNKALMSKKGEHETSSCIFLSQ